MSEIAQVGSNDPSLDTVYITAKRVCRIITAAGYDSVLFGSLASYLYGNRRVPRDVDVLVMPYPSPNLPRDPDGIKDLIIRKQVEFPELAQIGHFFIIVSRHRFKPHRDLWFMCRSTGRQEVCKIDIAVPGMMSLPPIPQSGMKWLTAEIECANVEWGIFCVAPISVVLLSLLFAWDEHGKKGAAYVDYVDILILIGCRSRRRDIKTSLAMESTKGIWALFDSEFQRETRKRVVRFCESEASSSSSRAPPRAQPDTEIAEWWAEIGFSNTVRKVSVVSRLIR
ncbi:hypothetical protein EW146_g5288 [Bondarzewia mesenterica]|uniref:Uncharacterized protein n=1 Tax=Bondarzewia mesenterica TaxID=1095465 RepID=A0A4S4LRZ5_9AGAM|nr:hypothetical protein EW146_g5288 [Bondarzewia mesenterica]